MTTEHVSVPRDELEEIARELSKYEAREVAYYARHFGEELQAILSRATPSESDLAIHMDRDAWRAAMIGLCHGAMSDVGTPDKAADHLRKRLAKAKPSAPRVVTEPLSVFSGGMWTWNETGQSFTKAEMDEAAFIVYRDHAESFATSLPAANSAKGGSNV